MLAKVLRFDFYTGLGWGFYHFLLEGLSGAMTGYADDSQLFEKLFAAFLGENSSIFRWASATFSEFVDRAHGIHRHFIII